ncbi:MAG: hypothetical protein PVI86_14400 [Phycisphaerae bacterium]|jgi:hypothetical protein
MFDTPIIDVAIGLFFVYAVLSLISTAIGESIAGLFRFRANNLKRGITRLLQEDPQTSFLKETFLQIVEPFCWPRTDDTPLVREFYKHPLLHGLMRNTKKPSYIPPRTFARVLLDLNSVRDAVKYWNEDKGHDDDPNPANKVLKALNAMDVHATHVTDKALERIETWFNDAMDRASGWYTRKVQFFVAFIALGVTIAANADTFTMAEILWRDPATRTVIAAMAERISKEQENGQADPTRAELADLRGRMESAGLLGWPERPAEKNGQNETGITARDPRLWPDTRWAGFRRVLGWLLTAVAVSLGAPFWFDLLNRFIRIRSAGAKLTTESEAAKAGPTAGARRGPQPMPRAPKARLQE